MMYAISQMTQHFMHESNLEDLVNSLEHDANLVIKWLDCGYMKLNEDRCHTIISGHKSKAI